MTNIAYITYNTNITNITNIIHTTTEITYDTIIPTKKNELKLCNHTEIVNQNSETLLSTASIYSSFLQNSFKSPTSQSKILRHGFTESNVQKVYQLPFIFKQHSY